MLPYQTLLHLKHTEIPPAHFQLACLLTYSGSQDLRPSVGYKNQPYCQVLAQHKRKDTLLVGIQLKTLAWGEKKNWKKKNLPREKASGLVAWWIAQFFKLSLHIFHCKSVRSETCIPGSKRPEPQSETLFTRYQKSIVSAYHRHIPSHFTVRHCLPYKTD